MKKLEALLERVDRCRIDPRGFCGAVALEALLKHKGKKASYEDVIEVCKLNGMVCAGTMDVQALWASAVDLGLKVDVKGVKQVQGVRAEEAAKGRHGLLVVKGHVMPVIKGRLMNKCGYGEEPTMLFINVR